MRLQNKVAVITGAASGMGLAIAELFAREGAQVVAADWNAERLKIAVEKIQKDGGAIIGVEGNIADQAAAEGLVDKAIETYGRIDILVNNADIAYAYDRGAMGFSD